MNKAKLSYKRAAVEEVEAFQEFIKQFKAKLTACVVTEQEAPGLNTFYNHIIVFENVLRNQISTLKNQVLELEKKEKFGE